VTLSIQGSSVRLRTYFWAESIKAKHEWREKISNDEKILKINLQNAEK
jgi:hypothetical protein